jgi:hypothetical protein
MKLEILSRSERIKDAIYPPDISEYRKRPTDETFREHPTGLRVEEKLISVWPRV